METKAPEIPFYTMADPDLLSNSKNSNFQNILGISLENIEEPYMLNYIEETPYYEYPREIQTKSLYLHKSIKSPEYIPKQEIKNKMDKIDLIALSSLINQTPRPRSNPSIWLNPVINQNNYDYPSYNALGPEDLPRLAQHIIDFIQETQPHIVIGCDRGGRLFGLAVHTTWQETMGGQPFPTLDGKLHFARISKSEDEDVLQEKIDDIVARTVEFGRQRGKTVEEDEQLRVLSIDDWVIGGGTKLLAKRLMTSHGAKAYFAVMCGEGADATGQFDQQTFVTWHDHPDEIGVNYLSTVAEDADGNVIQQQEVVAVRGDKAVKNRRKIHEAARNLPSRTVSIAA